MTFDLLFDSNLSQNSFFFQYCWYLIARPLLLKNVRLQGGICPEKFPIHQIQNGRLIAIINFNMPNIWQTVPNSYTITVERNVFFQVRICPEKFQLIKFKMADY